MSAAEKAKELYDKMLNGFQFTIDEYTAKACALISADETLAEMSEYADEFDCTITFEKCDYWQEVKQELEKL
jgi:hypothetical protein